MRPADQRDRRVRTTLAATGVAVCVAVVAVAARGGPAHSKGISAVTTQTPLTAAFVIGAAAAAVGFAGLIVIVLSVEGGRRRASRPPPLGWPLQLAGLALALALPAALIAVLVL